MARFYCFATLLVVHLFIAQVLASSAPAADIRPNVLVIVVDDLGYAELGCQGNRDIPTPHIDSLAESGIRFTQAYVAAPYCAPSRAGFITGRYPARFGYDRNPVGAQNLNASLGLPPTERTMADILKDAGYVTGLVGKWHLGGTPPHHPRRRGFDEFYGFLHEGRFYAPVNSGGLQSFLRTNQLPADANGRWTNGPVVWSTHMKNNEPAYDTDNPVLRGVDTIVEPGFLTDAWGKEACAFITRHRKNPWFLLLAYNAPHSPMQSTTNWLERFPSIPDLHRKVFAGMLGHLDASIGQVLSTVGALGLEERTLIVLFSDNGGPTRELTSSNSPLRGGKGQLWEGGIRIPFLLQWKGRLPSGAVYPHPVTALDILPTALAAAGAARPDGLDGVDLLPYLTAQRSGRPHTQLFWRYQSQSALRDGDWKWVRGTESNAGVARLYDLGRDPAETEDLAGRHPERFREMEQAWEKWNAANPAPAR